MAPLSDGSSIPIKRRSTSMNLAARLPPYLAMPSTGRALSKGLSLNLTNFGAAMRFDPGSPVESRSADEQHGTLFEESPTLSPPRQSEVGNPGCRYSGRGGVRP